MISAIRRRLSAWASQPRQWLGGPRWSQKSVTAGAVTVLVAVAAIFGLLRVQLDTTASAFLPANDPAISSLQVAARAFGGDPIVILAESAQPRALLDGDSLGRLVGLEGRLAKLPNVAVVYGPGTLLNQIVGSTRDMMAAIFGGRDGTRKAAESASRAAGASPDAVKAAGDAAVNQYDQRYGALLIDALPAGLPSLRSQQFVNTVIFDKSGNPKPAWQFLIPAPNAVAILVRPREDLDQAGTDQLVQQAKATAAQAGLKTSRLTVSGTPTVFADLGHSVQREIPLLGAVALTLITGCYVLVPWTRRRRHRLVPIVSTVSSTIITLALFGWLGIKLSLGAITFLPILIGVGSDFPAYVIHGVPRRRILVAAGASAAGFASLGLSPLPFVRDLGLALGFGVLLAVCIAMLIRTFFLSGVAEHSDDAERDVSGDIDGAVTTPSGTSYATGSPTTPAIAGRTRALVLSGLLVVAAVGWVLLPKLDVQAQPEQLAAGLPSVIDAQHVESVMGSSGEIDVVLRGANVRTPQGLAWLRQAQNAIVLRYGDSLPPAISLPSLLNFLGPNPSQSELDAGLGLLPHYLTAAVINDDGNESVISLGISLQDLRNQQALLTGLQAALPPAPPGLTVQVVGLPVAAARGYELVSQHRYLANIAGILAAGLVLLLGLSRRSDALRAVLAAALATGWGLAGALLLHIPLNPLSLALGSLTTATACEFTILLSYASTHERRTLRRTVLVAALAAALGYLALTVSALAVLVQFGLLLAATVGLSLLAAAAVVWLLPPDQATPPAQIPHTEDTTPEVVP